MSPERYASPDEARDAAQNWTDAMLACRTLRHAWTPSRASHNKRMRYFKVVQTCMRCRTERHMEIGDRRGTVYASWYEYPEGYVTKGIGRIVGDAMDAVRLSGIERAYEIEELPAKEAREATPRKSTIDALEEDS